MCEDVLYSLRVQDSGRLLACGSRQGVATLLDMSPGLSSLQKNEKSLVSAVRTQSPQEHQTGSGGPNEGPVRPQAWTMSRVDQQLLLVQMFERETKREKILEARQREMRLKERSRSQQSREDEPGPDQDQDSSQQLVARAQKEFFLAVEAELGKPDQARSVL